MATQLQSNGMQCVVIYISTMACIHTGVACDRRRGWLHNRANSLYALVEHSRPPIPCIRSYLPSFLAHPNRRTDSKATVPP